MFVLDEADEMLSRGFKDQIHDVFKNLPTEVQVNIILMCSFNYIEEENVHFFNFSRTPILQIGYLVNSKDISV